MNGPNRIAHFSLPTSVIAAVHELAYDTNVSIHTIVTTALEDYLHETEDTRLHETDIAQARNNYIDTHARYAVDGNRTDVAEAYIRARQTLLDLLDRQEP